MNEKPVLSCTDLTIGYKSQKTAVKEISKGLNLTLKRKELVCLIGPNGSGKSTLIRTLTGIQPSICGEVWLHGRRINEFTSDEKAKTLSVVLTTPVQTGYMTAFDIVALGRFPYTNWAGRLSNSDKSIVTNALSSVGAGNLSHRFIHEMSDGEKQKVMIARALAQEPELMVLDEPTAFLDLPHKIETMRILRMVAQKTGKSILLSTHDLNLAIRCADQLWILNRSGTMIAGTPEDLVLSGIFGSAFEIDGVHFDTTRGEFTIPVEKRGTFHLDAPESIQKIWTAYAMERIGYVPANGSSPDIVIQVTTGDSTPVWQISHQGGKKECQSIREMVECISSSWHLTGGDPN
ncbi:ABC transporter ATP-binding protein [Methanospirillum stamsii]|uniref:Cobalamin import ATP-binding protein BtuD n=1 Tax=Methanospirillum stamsii TaxID=1277351 RepID=A0A2V2NDP7_9EURY|nr:ABC transporter ATP-binding protein [Methanospirillum stamsii]PWR75716.1 ABC transporter ATP-binding protein [Methanospirillum stamsii]